LLACMHAGKKRAYRRTQTNKQTNTHTQIHTHTCTHTNTRTHIHTYTHLAILAPLAGAAAIIADGTSVILALTAAASVDEDAILACVDCMSERVCKTKLLCEPTVSLHPNGVCTKPNPVPDHYPARGANGMASAEQRVPVTHWPQP